MVDCCDDPDWFVWGYNDDVASCRSCGEDEYDPRKVKKIIEEQSEPRQEFQTDDE